MEYKLNTIVWIEDQVEVICGLLSSFCMDKKIREEYGSGMKYFISEIDSKVSNEIASSEIEKLVNEAGDNQAILVFKTAQTARGYLEQYIPGAIFCDSNFPLNGKVVVGWLKEHGLPDYPLNGLSAKYFDELDPEVQEFFCSTSAKYFRKMKATTDELIDAAIFSRQYVELSMNRGKKARQQTI